MQRNAKFEKLRKRQKECEQIKQKMQWAYQDAADRDLKCAGRWERLWKIATYKPRTEKRKESVNAHQRSQNGLPHFRNALKMTENISWPQTFWIVENVRCRQPVKKPNLHAHNTYMSAVLEQISARRNTSWFEQNRRASQNRIGLILTGARAQIEKRATLCNHPQCTPPEDICALRSRSTRAQKSWQTEFRGC